MTRETTTGSERNKSEKSQKKGKITEKGNKRYEGKKKRRKNQVCRKARERELEKKITMTTDDQWYLMDW